MSEAGRRAIWWICFADFWAFVFFNHETVRMLDVLAVYAVFMVANFSDECC